MRNQRRWFVAKRCSGVVVAAAAGARPSATAEGLMRPLGTETGSRRFTRERGVTLQAQLGCRREGWVLWDSAMCGGDKWNVAFVQHITTPKSQRIRYKSLLVCGLDRGHANVGQRTLWPRWRLGPNGNVGVMTEWVTDWEGVSEIRLSEWLRTGLRETRVLRRLGLGSIWFGKFLFIDKSFENFNFSTEKSALCKFHR